MQKAGTMSRQNRYIWTDLPGVLAYFEDRTYMDGSKGQWLVVQENGKRIYKQSWLPRHQEKGIEKVVREGLASHERSQKLLVLECPDCGSSLQDNTLKEGTHKGHGTLFCPVCEKVLMWI